MKINYVNATLIATESFWFLADLEFRCNLCSSTKKLNATNILEKKMKIINACMSDYGEL